MTRSEDDTSHYSLDEIRQALALPGHVPLIDCDARLRRSGKNVLITLVDHLRALAMARETTP